MEERKRRGRGDGGEEEEGKRRWRRDWEKRQLVREA